MAIQTPALSFPWGQRPDLDQLLVRVSEILQSGVPTPWARARVGGTGGIDLHCSVHPGHPSHASGAELVLTVTRHGYVYSLAVVRYGVASAVLGERIDAEDLTQFLQRWLGLHEHACAEAIDA